MLPPTSARATRPAEGTDIGDEAGSRTVGPRDDREYLDAVAELDDLGYPTLWLTGGRLERLDQIGAAVRAASSMRIATGIIPVVRFDSDAVAAAYAEVESTHPGRFVVGLGGAHGPRPVGTLTDYLGRLDDARHEVPASARVLAALGPRMLALSRDRASGALPVLVTPEYTARAREVLGDDTTLAVMQFVVLQKDTARAREIGRDTVAGLSTLPGYAANLRRMGFTDDEVTRVADRLVDGVVALGGLDGIATRVTELRDAGADHVALNVLTGSSELPLPEWRDLADAFVA